MTRFSPSSGIGCEDSTLRSSHSVQVAVINLAVLSLVPLLICGCNSGREGAENQGAGQRDSPQAGRSQKDNSSDNRAQPTPAVEKTPVAPKAGDRSALFGGAPVRSLPTDVTSLGLDRDGILWIGSRYSGIYAMIHEQATLFNQYNTPIPDCGISAIFVDRDNTKWFGSSRGFLCSFDNTHWKVFQSDAERGPISRIRQDRQGRIWLATEGGTVFRVRDGRVEEIKPEVDGEFEPADGDIRDWWSRIRWSNGRRFTIELGRPLITEEGQETREFARGTPLYGETVNDIAIESPNRFWFAVDRVGLLRLDGKNWKSFTDLDPHEPPYVPPRPRLSDDRERRQDTVRQKAIDVDIHEVLKNPRTFAGKKIRFTGTIEGSFEYGNILDEKGKRLGIWPSRGGMWYVASQAGLIGREAARNNRREFVGFLDWGGYFGHLGGWRFELHAIEEYPADATAEQKARIKRAFLDYLEKESIQAPIPPPDPSPAAKQAQGTLNGVWSLADPKDGEQFTRWVFRDGEVQIRSIGERHRGIYRIDMEHTPARIDIAWSQPYLSDRPELGIFRLAADKIYICHDRVLGGQVTRPVEFFKSTDEGVQGDSVELVRDRDAVVPDLDVDESAVDDPTAFERLHSAGADFQFDNCGRVVHVGFGSGDQEAPQVVTTMMESLTKLPRLESVAFGRAKVTDADLAYLARCPKLISICSCNAQPGITDAGIEHVKKLTRLERLELKGPNITDVGLTHLAGLTALESLSLEGARVSGSGLRNLTKCSRLKSLSIESQDLVLDDQTIKTLGEIKSLVNFGPAGPRISRESVQALVNAVPRLNVWFQSDLVRPISR